MKKIILILSLCLIPSICNAATSDDVYVRKDIFEAKFERVFDEFAKIHAELQNQARRIDVLTERIDQTSKSFEAQIRLIDTHMYYFMVILGILLGIPVFQRILEWHDNRKPNLTIEDVKRLIEESKHS